MTNKEPAPPLLHDSEERIDPGGASGEPGAGLGAPADAPGYEDAVGSLQKQDENAAAAPSPAEGEDVPQPSPADGGD